MVSDPSTSLAFTGERFIPGTRGEIWIEHWHRYHFALRWAAGRQVLDIACGEGYGSALLARRAAHVTGVDVSLPAIEHARAAYGALGNVDFREGSCTRIPVPDGSVELAVSFETLEHIAEQEAFLEELARVLAPGGVLLLSSPNKAEYSDKRGFSNEFHVKELYREELERLVRERLPEIDWYGQRPAFYSLIAPERPTPWGGQLAEVSEAKPDEASSRLATAVYFLLAASRDRGALTSVAPVLSVFSDRDDWVHQDYEAVIADVNAYAVKTREMTAAIEAKEGELRRREGWAWWLRWPLVRLGFLK